MIEAPQRLTVWYGTNILNRYLHLATLQTFGVITPIDIKSLQNRLLKVCYVTASSAGLPRLLFLMWPLTVLMKQTKQAVHAIKQSMLLRCLCLLLTPPPPFQHRPKLIKLHFLTHPAQITWSNQKTSSLFGLIDTYGKR